MRHCAFPSARLRECVGDHAATRSKRDEPAFALANRVETLFLVHGARHTGSTCATRPASSMTKVFGEVPVVAVVAAAAANSFVEQGCEAFEPPSSIAVAAAEAGGGGDGSVSL
jgi:hypothetical protein